MDNNLVQITVWYWSNGKVETVNGYVTWLDYCKNMVKKLNRRGRTAQVRVSQDRQWWKRCPKTQKVKVAVFANRLAETTADKTKKLRP